LAGPDQKLLGAAAYRGAETTSQVVIADFDSLPSISPSTKKGAIYERPAVHESFNSPTVGFVHHCQVTLHFLLGPP
jgi:hypothetical protein